MSYESVTSYATDERYRIQRVLLFVCFSFFYGLTTVGCLRSFSSGKLGANLLLYHC